VVYLDFFLKAQLSYFEIYFQFPIFNLLAVHRERNLAKDVRQWLCSFGRNPKSAGQEKEVEGAKPLINPHKPNYLNLHFYISRCF
jgi:hypothetical protein